MISAIVVIAFVVVVLLAVAYVLFELSPLARHSEVLHEPGRRQQSPRLD